ncbi:PREDICTED: carcinoembryonic antigen-related cell adhesion molecule 7-like [Myotis davidii]|uniref:carcinoembryonic antigen-related cell adhesion molecule 7-like n=1 Tax=Myotis davidii TaxID=225400 RepID=UPI0007670796|nr:PREDICTED: carcinoembryonic antigen-related cell adhesion molecule 7-like [Myotis davidii]
MESPSAPAHRGLVPRQGLLLAATLFTFWSLPTTAQLTIESVPRNAAEGKDVLLRVHNLPGNLGGYAWYTGEIVDSNHKIVSYVIDTQKITYGPAYSDREKIYPNGSLLFQNVTRKDTGYYILLAIDKNFLSKPVTGQLRVYPELPKPNITSNNSLPEEHKDPVVLTCEPQTQDTTYLWLISNQSLPASARLQLSKDNRTLTLLPVTRKDTGPYECETRNLVSASRSDPFTLNVVSEQNYTGYSVGTIVGSVIGVLVVVALGASLSYFVYLRRTRRASDSGGLREHPPPTATSGQGPSGTSAFPGPLPDSKTTGPIYEELLNPNTEVYCRIIPRADVAS